MKSRPILFSAPMVRAILDGSKTQTRRIVTDQSLITLHADGSPAKAQPRCRIGQPGDQLWVQESHRLRNPIEATESVECNYAEDGEQKMVPLQNREFVKMMLRENRVGSDYGAIIPGRFMYKSLSRITLEITGIRVERLREISEADAEAEGVGFLFNGSPLDPRPDRHQGCFQLLWEHINGLGSWDTNPWVWVVEFKRIEGGAK